ncbi:MAG: right-handed parallel beta-helix repeat-containing protein, partial [Methanobacteriota archaeon]
NGKPVYYWKNIEGGQIPLDAGEVILANCTNIIAESLDVSNTSMGIQLGFSSRNTVRGNEVSNNSYGIQLVLSQENTIINNTVYGNRYGTSIFWSNDSKIVDNNISSNWRGVYLSLSESNWIYHNNFTDNSMQAFDDGNANYWDYGYPSGGNYWSNYSGADNMSGPNQDQPGSDGIGYIPFIIDADSQDRFPLVSFLGVGLPRPPAVVYANLSGKDSENVTIIWTLSPDDRPELQTVIGYRVYRNLTYDALGIGYGLLASLGKETSEFVDSQAGEGDPNNYFYRVCVVDSTSKTTCSTDQAAKFTRPLSVGLNLISVPLIQSVESIETVLQTVSFTSAWLYSSFDQEWKSFIRSKPWVGDLENLNHTMGLWVDISGSSNLTVAGIAPLFTSIQLRSGWNLVSSPSFKGNRTVAYAKLQTNATRIEAFDSLCPPYYLKKLEDSDVLLAGFGYWVYVEDEMTWIVYNF